MLAGGLITWNQAADDLWSGDSNKQKRGILEFFLGLTMLAAGLAGVGRETLGHSYGSRGSASTAGETKTLDELKSMVLDWIENNRGVYDFSGQGDPKYVSIAYDSNTGRAYYGRNYWCDSPNPDYIHPALQHYVPSENLEGWWVYNCAEMDAVNQALWHGSDLGDIQLYTYNNMRASDGYMCANCSSTFLGSPVNTVFEGGHNAVIHP